MDLPEPKIDLDKLPRLLALEQEVCAIAQIEKHLQFNDSSILFSIHELNYCHKKPNPIVSLAGLWCTKKAFTKASVHFSWFPYFSWLDLEIRHTPIGQPLLMLHNELGCYCHNHKIAVEISIAHIKEFAVAAVIIYFRS